MEKLKGYHYQNVTARIIQKNSYLFCRDLDEQVDRKKLNERMQNTLNDGGKVYFIRQKKEVCGIVRIEYKKYMASDFAFLDEEKPQKDWKEKLMDCAVKMEEDTTGMLGEKNKRKEEEKKKLAFAYELSERILCENLKGMDKSIMNDILTMLKESSSLEENGVKVYIWNDTIIADKTLGRTGMNAVSIGICLGMCLGAAFGMLFSSNHGNSGFLGLYVSTGLCIGMALGSAYEDIATKKNKTKNTENKRV